jgi:EPS-associated MarR family transcriptional regulator
MNGQPLKEDIFSILRILSSNGEFTQRDLSAHMGISLGKTNYLLKALAGIGLLEIRNFTVRGQKVSKVRYLLTRKGFEEKVRLTHGFLKKKEQEYNQMKKEWDALNGETSKVTEVVQ